MTFNNILNEIEELSDEQQESLIDIVKKRLLEKRRDEIAEDAKKSLLEYQNGKLHPERAEEIISRLHKAVDRD
jgi:hypothetical protein